jgi:hypothetical protein
MADVWGLRDGFAVGLKPGVEADGILSAEVDGNGSGDWLTPSE